MSYRRPITGRAPNYTNAFLVTFGINLFIGLFAAAIAWGFGWALILFAAFDIVVQWARNR